MRNKINRLFIAALALALTPLGLRAQSLDIQYFEIAETDRDANSQTFGNFPNFIQTDLGPNGLPVLNTPAFGCTSDCVTPAEVPSMPKDVLANGEITWWSPALNNGGPGGTSDVTATGTGTVSLPVCLTTCENGNYPQNFFAPNGKGSSDYNGFLSAILTGNLVVPSTVSSETLQFAIGADDMAFAFLNGKEVCDLGGVHAATTGTCVAPFAVGPGTYSLEVFFVDVDNSQAGLYFNVLTSGVTVTPPGGGTSQVPEPASLTLLALGMAGLGMTRRRLNRRR